VLEVVPDCGFSILKMQEQTSHPDPSPSEGEREKAGLRICTSSGVPESMSTAERILL
jgi:hypothetical protein